MYTGLKSAHLYAPKLVSTMESVLLILIVRVLVAGSGLSATMPTAPTPV